MVAIAVTLLAAGCSPGLFGPDDPMGTEATTGLRISVPRFSPWLHQAIGGTTTSAARSRALAIADSFRVIVSDATDTEVYNQLYTPDPAISESQTCTIELDPGTGYSVEVFVYNDDNDFDGGLVVHGTAENITITDGQTTSVSVACTPVYPIGFTVGTVSGPIDLTTSQITASYEVLNLGEEFWMIFQAPASGTIRVTPSFSGTSTCEHVVGIYEQTGEPVKSFGSTPPSTEGEGVLVGGLTPGATYYGVYLPLSQTRETVSGTILIEEVVQGDCGYDGVDARSVSGTVDFSAFEIAGVTITSVSVLASLPAGGGSTEGIHTIYPADFTGTGFTADYTLSGMDPSVSYNIFYQVAATYDGTDYDPFDGPHTPDLSAGDITEYDFMFPQAYIAEITLNMTYTGSGTVDENHPLVLNLDLTDHGYIEDTAYLTVASGSVTLRSLVAQDTLYVEGAFDADGSGWHSDWDPMCFYGETAADRSPDAIDISSGPVTIDFTLDDSIRFNVDDSTAYPLAIDGVWYGSLDGFGNTANTFDAGPAFLYTFETDDGTYWETYRIWEWDNDSGFFILQMLDCSDAGNSGIDKYSPSGWSNLTGSGADATVEMFGYGDETDYFMFDTVEAARAADRSNPMPALALSASPPAGSGTLEVTIQ